MRSSCVALACSILFFGSVAQHGYRVAGSVDLRHFSSSNQSLVPGAASLKTGPNQGNELGGTSWQLVKFQGGDDTTLIPDDRTKYTISFGTDGRLTARVDCNRGTGTWKSSGPNQIQFGPMAITRAMCPPGSMHDQIVRQWENVSSYIIRDGHLFLALKLDSGIYEYEPEGAKAGPQKSAVESKGPIHYACTQTGGGNSPITATFYQTEPALVLVERESQSRPAFRVEAASGAKYEGTNVMFWESKGEAMVTWSGIDFKCKPFSNGSVPAASLSGKKWKLIDVNGVAVKTGKPYIEFDDQANRFSGDGGCNRITGSFKIDGPNIKFSQGVSTQRACIDNDVQMLETDFFRGLGDVTSFQIQGETLRLYKGNQPLLTFSAEPTGTTGSLQDGQVTGTVSYRQRIALTPDAIIEVRLLDVSRADAPAVTIAQQTIKPAGRQVPIAFEIRYDPGRIEARNRYVIQARILEGGQLRFINSQAYPVITEGNPRELNMIVEPVGQ